MASRLIDWTLAHLWLMRAIVGLTFLVMLFIPDARWNAITTAWGVVFLALLIPRHEGVLSRVTQLDTALDRFLDALHWYEEAIAKDNPAAEYARAAPRFYLLPIGDAAVRLCEGCADLLFEARLLRP